MAWANRLECGLFHGPSLCWKILLGQADGAEGLRNNRTTEKQRLEARRWAGSKLSGRGLCAAVCRRHVDGVHRRQRHRASFRQGRRHEVFRRLAPSPPRARRSPPETPVPPCACETSVGGATPASRSWPPQTSAPDPPARPPSCRHPRPEPPGSGRSCPGKSVSSLAAPPRHFLPHLLQGQSAPSGPRILGPRRQQFAPQPAPGPRWPRRFPLQLLADGVSHPFPG